MCGVGCFIWLDVCPLVTSVWFRDALSVLGVFGLLLFVVLWCFVLVVFVVWFYLCLLLCRLIVFVMVWLRFDFVCLCCCLRAGGLLPGFTV